MNKREFYSRVNELMRDAGMRKPVSLPKSVFHISDDDGNTRDFVVKKSRKDVIYTVEDVSGVIEAAIEVIKECIKRGEEVRLPGFGIFGVRHRKPRRTKLPGTGEWIDVEGRYLPWFQPFTELKVLARLYGRSLDEDFNGDYAYIPNDTDEDIEDELDGE